MTQSDLLHIRNFSLMHKKTPRLFLGRCFFSKEVKLAHKLVFIDNIINYQLDNYLSLKQPSIKALNSLILQS